MAELAYNIGPHSRIAVLKSRSWQLNGLGGSRTMGSAQGILGVLA